MIGWAAVTGNVSAVGIALFLLIFLWTPPHFWALALYRSDDYRRAGVPMLPVVVGPRETKRQIYRDLTRDAASAVSAAEALLEEMVRHPDYAEGVKAWMQKRAAQWSG